MDIQPHAFLSRPGSTRCAVPGCGSPRLAMIHAVRPEEAIAGCVECGEPLSPGQASLCRRCQDAMPSGSPFPVEPAFGSPEAVKQAAETIREFLPPTTEQTIGYLESEVERLTSERDGLVAQLEGTSRALEVVKSEAERLRLTLSNLESHLDETRGQREALADALLLYMVAPTEPCADCWPELARRDRPVEIVPGTLGVRPVHSANCRRVAAEAALRLVGRLP